LTTLSPMRLRPSANFFAFAMIITSNNILVVWVLVHHPLHRMTV